jgi:hypothetical protein
MQPATSDNAPAPNIEGPPVTAGGPMEDNMNTATSHGPQSSTAIVAVLAHSGEEVAHE